MTPSSDGSFLCPAPGLPCGHAYLLTLITGKAFDVDGELLEVARQLQAEGAHPRLISFTAHISGKVTNVLINPEHVVLLAGATGSDLRRIVSGACPPLEQPAPASWRRPEWVCSRRTL
jgi:hypothetical protein